MSLIKIKNRADETGQQLDFTEFKTTYGLLLERKSVTQQMSLGLKLLDTILVIRIECDTRSKALEKSRTAARTVWPRSTVDVMSCRRVIS